MAPVLFEMESFHVSSGNSTIPTATVRLKTGEGVMQDAACGDGPVDAIYRTIDRITGFSGTLVDYNIRAVTSGKDALGEVILTAEVNGMRYSGKASSTDIIEASALAYMNAVNRAAAASSGRKKSRDESPEAVEKPEL